GAARLASMVGLLGVLTLMTPAAWAAEPLSVILDQAMVSRVPDGVATVVVGNPLIADVSLQAGGILVITGKGYGSTNLVALDRAGKVLMDEQVLVRGPRNDILVMYRGVDRETYSCTPNCERSMVPGDADKAFGPALAQTKARDDAARSIASPPSPVEDE